MGVKKTGDWNRVGRVIGSLSHELRESRRICLERFALKVEGTAKTHISLQDLPWRPLKPKTIAAKVSKGQSENILVASSTYFQSITSYVVGGTAYAGVKREARYSGENGSGEVWQIAKIHEYGSNSGNIPKRELWRPSLEETLNWTVDNNNPAKIFLERIKRK